MNITSMSSFGLNVINNTYIRIKESTVKQLAGNGKLLELANEIKKVSNRTIAFIKKHPRNIVTGIGFASMLVGVITVNPGLICVGVSSLVAATLYTPPSLKPPPSHDEIAQHAFAEAG